jgi:hypothetical protein
MSMKHTSTKLAAALALLLAQAAWAQEDNSVTIIFEGTGAEAGIISGNTTDFDFMGSSWSGGFVATQGIGALYASGRFSYHVDDTVATVVFDPPVSEAEFFYVHGGNFGQGTATAFGTSGNMLGSVSSLAATRFNDPNNFVEFENTNEPIAMIQFDGGVIDNFEFTPTTGGGGGDDFDFQSVEGSWLNDAVRGSGILFDYGPSIDQMFVTWVTHTVDREIPTDPPPADDIGFTGHRWVNALLTLDGNVATGDMFVVEGGQFDTPADDNQRSRVIGNITVTFSSCNSGVFEYTFDAPINRSGSFDIVQLESVVSPGFSCGEMMETQ